VIYRLGDVGVVINMLVNWEDIYWDIKWCCELLKWSFTPLFIGFDLKSLFNSLQSPLLHETTLFLQSIGHIHPCFCDPFVMFISITLPMYQILCLLSLFSMLPNFLTSYFSSLLIIVGGSTGSICYLLNCGSLLLVSRSSLNTLWIIHPSGSSSWNAPWPISFEILKDPYLF